MKTEFKAKFLQNISKKRSEEGFTLIELLVVIIIIGILSAIALPSFLNQANKAKQTEAKQYIASMNKGQQAYYAENGSFVTATANIPNLGLGIKTSTANYTYALGALGATSTGATAYTATMAGGLRAYAGVVFLTLAAGSEAATSQSIMCDGPNKTGNTTGLTAEACSGDFSNPISK